MTIPPLGRNAIVRELERRHAELQARQSRIAEKLRTVPGDKRLLRLLNTAWWRAYFEIEELFQSSREAEAVSLDDTSRRMVGNKLPLSGRDAA